MEQLFIMPIKVRLDFRARDRQSTDQATLNKAFQYFFLSFYKFINNISRFQAYFISKPLFQIFHVSTIPFLVRFTMKFTTFLACSYSFFLSFQYIPIFKVFSS